MSYGFTKGLFGRGGGFSRAGFASFGKNSPTPPDSNAAALLEAIGIPNDSTIYYEGTAQDITGEEAWAAFSRFFRRLKGYGFYNKYYAIYAPFGATAAAHKFNAVNPADTNAAFRLTFAGGLTHSATGILPNGTTGWAETHLSPAASMTNNDSGLVFYSRTNNNVGADLGSSVASTGFFGLAIQNTTGFSGYIGSNSTTTRAIANSLGLFTADRSSGTTLRLYRNGVKLTDVAQTNNGLPPGTMRLFRGYNGTYGSKECAFMAIRRSLTEAQHAQEYEAVQGLMADLKREV